MASEKPEHSQADCQPAGTRLVSAPAASSVGEANSAVEKNGVTQASDNPAMCSTVASSTDTMTPSVESASQETVSRDLESSPSVAEQPSQQERNTMQKPTVKPEPDSPEANLSAVHPAMAMGATQKETVKVEQQPDTTAATRPPQELKEISLTNLSGVANSSELAVLEAGVTAACTVLDQLRIPMADFKQHKELLDWLTLIDDLKAKAKKTGRTVVAVAGATGAGKSSLINAVLNEEKLLPTNGMRACTAVITEILYNEIGDDPQKAYRAEVEFISLEDWNSELNVLFEELLDDNKQLSPAWRDANSEAGVAYAKVKSVYPQLTHEMLVKSNPRQLAKDETVARILGTKREFACSTARELHSLLSRYMDSREKSGSSHKAMALWPIIRVVRIYTRADALSTNVCLVDLPGVADSNAARSAVANKFLAECTAVWVAARISRAVDDKAAKDLLGRSSRIQMKLDGMYSALSFIATQTDAINIRETIDSLDGDGQIQATFSQEDELAAAIEENKTKIQQLEKQCTDNDEGYDAAEDELRTWQSLQKRQKKGQLVYKPAAPAKPANRTKRRRTSRRQVLDEGSDSDESTKMPLTADEISTKLEELNAVVVSKAAECEDAEKRCDTAKNELTQLEQQKEDIAVQRAWMCVQKRNTYCREAIRQDFAAGIREIDEEDDEVDAENYDPSVRKRNYDEVARSLQVFCVSAKAYQQHRKTTRGETQVEGFRIPEDSEIPSLQEHAKRCSHSGRIRSNKTFLNQFSQFLNSLRIWTVSSELALQPGQMSSEAKGYELKFLEIQIEKLKARFAEIVFQLKTELLKITREAFTDKASSAVSHASKVIQKTVDRWNTPVTKGGYGMTFATYRGICKRLGEKTPSVKARNFNEDVLEPYMLKIASSWELAFSRTIPAALDRFTDTFVKELEGFHATMSSREELQKGRKASMRLLGAQLRNHEATIQNAINSAKSQLQTDQREASRLFLPQIKESMKKVYTQCAGEKGPGCYNRMKEAMLEIVRKNKSNMYRKPGQKVNKELEKDFQAIANSLSDDCEHIRGMLASDYKLILTSAEMIEVNAVVREHIHDILYKTDTKFEVILNGAQPMEIDAVPTTQPATQPASEPASEPAGPAGLERAGCFDVEGAGMAVDASVGNVPDSSRI